jgi:DNA-binding transcriptional LysR family regulator
VAELHLVWRRDSTNPALPAFRDAIVRQFAPDKKQAADRS